MTIASASVALTEKTASHSSLLNGNGSISPPLPHRPLTSETKKAADEIRRLRESSGKAAHIAAVTCGVGAGGLSPWIMRLASPAR